MAASRWGSCHDPTSAIVASMRSFWVYGFFWRVRNGIPDVREDRRSRLFGGADAIAAGGLATCHRRPSRQSSIGAWNPREKRVAPDRTKRSAHDAASRVGARAWRHRDADEGIDWRAPDRIWKPSLAG